MTDKKELRKFFSGIRAEVHSPEKDRCIAENLFSSGILSGVDCVLLYASYLTEVSTWSIAEKLLNMGISAAFPKCGSGRDMSFHIITDLSQLKKGAYGIPEPELSAPQPFLSRNSVCIVPGLAFTLNGRRLGYGGGYYDKFLAGNPGIKTAALTYEALITHDLPAAEHDKPVELIITEERTVLCNEYR